MQKHKKLSSIGLRKLRDLMKGNVMEEDSEDWQDISLEQSKMWSFNGDKYYAVGDTCDKLPPDYYELLYQRDGTVIFNRLHFQTNDLVLFSEDVSDQVIKEITRFWQNPQKFDRFSLPYRRGILLYGPPGTGKSCTIKQILRQVIDLGGVGIKFTACQPFEVGMRTLRELQPDTPVICIMEDLESILQVDDESAILNLLDGVSGFENIVYIATSNYPEELGERISNRPSRFDKRYEIGYLNEASRKIYIEHLLKNATEEEIKSIDVKAWVKDTKNFTPAHIKELFISVVLYNDSYEVVIKSLKDMAKTPKSTGSKKQTGFVLDDESY